MWKGYAVGVSSSDPDAKTLSNKVLERSRLKETSYRELPDWNDERGVEELKLAFEPGRTCVDLLGQRNPVTTLGKLSGKAAANRRKIYPIAHLVLVPPKRARKPLEECLARSPRKGAAQKRLLVARCLAHEHDAARHRPANDDRLPHPGAPVAFQESRLVSFNRCRGSHT
jgi:hypothetical protein